MRTRNPIPHGRDDLVATKRPDRTVTAPALLCIPLTLLTAVVTGCERPAGTGGEDSASAPTSASIKPNAGAGVVVDTATGRESSSPLPANWSEPAAKSLRPEIDLTQYVPNNALAYIEIRSMDALEEALLRFSAIAELAGQSPWTPVDAMLPLTSAGVDPSRVDRTAPIGIALAPVPGEFVPGLVLIVPAATDAPIVHSIAAMKSRRMDASRVAGGYVVLQHDQMPGAEFTGNAAVTEHLPEGFIRGRVSVAAIRPLLAPYVRDLASSLNEQYRLARPRVSDSRLKKLDAEAVLDQLEVAEQIAFGLDLVHDQIDIEFRLVQSDRVDASSDTGRATIDVDATTLTELSRHIQTDDSLSLILGFDRTTMLDDLEVSWESAQSTDVVTLGDGKDTADSDLSLDLSGLESIEESVSRMLDSFEPGTAISISLEPAKAYAAIYLATEDPTRARDAISLLLSKCDLKTWGFEMSLPIRSKVDGITVEDYSVRFDTRKIGFDRRATMRAGFKTFLGDSTLHVKVAVSGDHVLLLLGGDTVAVSRRIRAFDSESLADEKIAKAVSRANRGSGATVVHLDLVQLLSQIAGFGAIASGESASYSHREIVREVGIESAQFTFWSSVDGDDELLGATFDLGELARAFEAFKTSGL